MDQTVVPTPVVPTLSRSPEERFKPAMAGQPFGSPASAPVPGAPDQGLRPVDPMKKRPLPSVLGIKLTPDLRSRIAAAAQKAGVSDSAWLRARALDALGVESTADAASGRRPRIPPQDQAALADCIRYIGEATMAARADRIDAAVTALERVRGVLIPAVLGFERRPA